MSEADRIQREQMLMGAMRDQIGSNQPVLGRLPAMTPAVRYQSLLADGLSKEEAQRQTLQMMQEANQDTYNQSGNTMYPVEGEF